MDFDTSKTKINLARAFAGECQGGARYQFMSKMALQDQMQFLADTLKTLAKNEMAHAKVFYDHITQNSGNVRNIPIEAGFPFELPDLKTSLLEEAQNEITEAQNIYPSFARIAKDEGFVEIAKNFQEIAKIEESHWKILDYIGKLFNSNKLYKRQSPTKWKCSSCGYSNSAKEGFKTCPVCSLPQGYIIIDLEKELNQ